MSACCCCTLSCCSCLPFSSSSSFSVISALCCALSFRNSMASPVFLLVHFGLSLPSSASSDALFLVWEKLSIAFILFFFNFAHTNNYNTLHLQFITGNCYRLQKKKRNKKKRKDKVHKNTIVYILPIKKKAACLMVLHRPSTRLSLVL